MQRPNEKKRQMIVAAAARLFATKPFHAVKLDEVAAAAGVGKGTVYIYFDSKESLYFSLVSDAFTQMVEQIRQQAMTEKIGPSECLRRIVTELVRFAFHHPHFFELIRTMGPQEPKKAAWRERRLEITRLIEDTIRRGVRCGEFSDKHPDLTALCIPGLARAVMLFGPKGLDEGVVAKHLVELVERGIGRRYTRPVPEESRP